MPTVRQDMVDLITACPRTPREFAEWTGLRVRDVLDHLEHIRRSQKKSFHIEPAECGKCGFVFRDRQRINTPSRCPKCRSEQISEPRFSIESDHSSSSR